MYALNGSFVITLLEILTVLSANTGIKSLTIKVVMHLKFLCNMVIMMLSDRASSLRKTFHAIGVRWRREKGIRW
jgi:hypothetical protein